MDGEIPKEPAHSNFLVSGSRVPCRLLGAANDPVLRLVLAGQIDRSSAKLVDLDPQFQMGSMIWGSRVTLTDGNLEYLRGTSHPALFHDPFFGRSPAGGSNGASAKFTSLLSDVEWAAEVGHSEVRAALRYSARQNGDHLSLSMMTSGYRSAGATSGFITVTLGPWVEPSPRSFVDGRRFAPQLDLFATSEGIGFFGAMVTGQTPTLDLSKALFLGMVATKAALADISPLHASPRPGTTRWRLRQVTPPVLAPTALAPGRGTWLSRQYRL